ncbi:helix-turn-helix domain-containing protein [Burkholderia gladioli]|uniref:helix-turn-helix domain-containing protein n=1 Tax=Burkholderia gladioli TaxID=28095 RepID=UPI00163F4BA1|nr:helix-turn-helix domain-containing protein [Burkholderia gladioli]
MSRPNRAELDSAFSSGRMTQAEAARRLGVGYLVLRYHVTMGRLATLQVDGRVWVRQEDLEAFKKATEGMLTIGEAASELGVNASILYDNAYRGELLTVKVGGRRLVRRVDLDEFRSRITMVNGPEVRAALETGLLTRSDVARELGVSHQRVSQLVKARSLATVKVGGRALVRPEELEAFMQKPRRLGPKLKGRIEQAC